VPDLAARSPAGAGRAWLLRGSAAVLLVLGLTLLAKYRLIEPMPVASRCQTGGDYPWWCVVREGIVLLFVKNIAGMASVLLGAWATIQRSARLAFAAICAGVVGMTLYRFDSAVIGVLLGVLVIARLAAGPVEQARAAEGGQ
jgi:hypothetical protein